MSLPAARVSDMHTCPMCMGAPLPIIPPTAIQTLIGGLPAARMGDLCSCVAPVPAPVDPIVMGSPTVLIEGRPAARVGDLTGKGGVILPPGCPTVLIGMVGVVTPSVPGMPGIPVPGMPEVPAVNPVCTVLKAKAKELEAAGADAVMAAAAMAGPGAPLPPGTRLALPEDLARIGLLDGLNDMTRLAEGLMQMAVFVVRDAITQAESYVMALVDRAMDSAADWAKAAAEGMRPPPGVMAHVTEMARTAEAMAPGAMRYVGQGAAAAAAAAASRATGAPASAFNPAGMDPEALAKSAAEAGLAKIRSYATRDNLQEKLGRLLGLTPLPGLIEDLPAPPVPAALAAAAMSALAGMGDGPLGPALAAMGPQGLASSMAASGMQAVQGGLADKAKGVASEMAEAGCPG